MRIFNSPQMNCIGKFPYKNFKEPKRKKKSSKNIHADKEECLKTSKMHKFQGIDDCNRDHRRSKLMRHRAEVYQRHRRQSVSRRASTVDETIHNPLVVHYPIGFST